MVTKPLKQSTSLRAGQLFAFTALGSLILLYLRMGNFHFISQSLWAEDGRIFFNQSEQLGVRSILVPYAGYIHLYPRLVALIAIRFPVGVVPYFFFFSWVAAFLSTIWVVVDRSKKVDLKPWTIALVAWLITLQPHSGEAFFTLTNAQWFLGVALALYVCLPSPIKRKWRFFEKLFLGIISLTGPFSILVSPVLALRCFILRDFRERKWEYLIIWISALIQIGFVLTSPRVHGHTQLDHKIAHWVKIGFAFLTFGGTNIGVTACSMVLWLAISALIVRAIVKKKAQPEWHPRFVLILMVLITGITFVAGGIGSPKPMESLTPIGWGARYFIIPYSLTFWSIAYATRNHSTSRVILLSTLGAIALLSFKPIQRSYAQRPDLQWDAYAKLAETGRDVTIPIGFQSFEEIQYPGWDIAVLGVPKSLKPIPEFNLMPTAKLARATSSIIVFKGNEIDIHVGNGQAQLLFKIDPMHISDAFIGVEIEVNRTSPGWTELYWGKDDNFSERRSLRRFYPAGNVKMQFAFHRKHGEDTLSFHPLIGVGEVKLRAVRLYCLDRVKF
jgi:hypothetical protein